MSTPADDTAYTARYWRYHSEGQEECDSLEEAVAFLANGQDSGNLSAQDILGPDGAVVLEGDELDRSIHTYLGV
jgi:hypothetical protein